MSERAGICQISGKPYLLMSERAGICTATERTVPQPYIFPHVENGRVDKVLVKLGKLGLIKISSSYINIFFWISMFVVLSYTQIINPNSTEKR